MVRHGGDFALLVLLTVAAGWWFLTSSGCGSSSSGDVVDAQAERLELEASRPVDAAADAGELEAAPVDAAGDGDASCYAVTGLWICDGGFPVQDL